MTRRKRTMEITPLVRNGKHPQREPEHARGIINYIHAMDERQPHYLRAEGPLKPPLGRVGIWKVRYGSDSDTLYHGTYEDVIHEILYSDGRREEPLNPWNPRIRARPWRDFCTTSAQASISQSCSGTRLVRGQSQSMPISNRITTGFLQSLRATSTSINSSNLIVQTVSELIGYER